MSLLLQGGLPHEIEGAAIYPDFRNMVAVEMILRDEEMDPWGKTMMALDMLYAETPKDVAKAVEGLLWFYTCGEAPAEEEGEGAAKGPAYDFDQDAGLIYAAFYAAYGISLTTVEFLHWWEFCALFAALPEDALIRKVMYWRSVEMRDVPKYEKEFVGKMKKAYALKKTGKAPKSLAEMERQTMDWAEERFAQAKRKMQEHKG